MKPHQQNSNSYFPRQKTTSPRHGHSNLSSEPSRGRFQNSFHSKSSVKQVVSAPELIYFTQKIDSENKIKVGLEYITLQTSL